MAKHLMGENSAFRIAIKHRTHKLLEEHGLFFAKAISLLNVVYLAIITSLRLQFCSLGMRIKLPS